MLPNLHLSHFSHFIAAAETDTWTNAAKHIGVTQSALSQSLREIERRLGVTLFEAKGRTRILTQAGIDVLRFSHEICGSGMRLAAHMEQILAGDIGKLRLGMIDAACLYLFPDAIRKFTQVHPHIDLQLSVDGSKMLFERLARGDIDMAIAVEHPDTKGIGSTQLYREPLFLFGNTKEKAPPAQLVKNSPLVLYNKGSHTRHQIDQELIKRGVFPDIRLESRNPQVLKTMAEFGTGQTILPWGVAGNSQTLAASKAPIVYRNIVIAWRKTFSLPSYAGTLTQLLKNSALLSPSHPANIS